MMVSLEGMRMSASDMWVPLALKALEEAVNAQESRDAKIAFLKKHLEKIDSDPHDDDAQDIIRCASLFHFIRLASGDPALESEAFSIAVGFLDSRSRIDKAYAMATLFGVSGTFQIHVKLSSRHSHAFSIPITDSPPSHDFSDSVPSLRPLVKDAGPVSGLLEKIASSHEVALHSLAVRCLSAMDPEGFPERAQSLGLLQKPHAAQDAAKELLALAARNNDTAIHILKAFEGQSLASGTGIPWVSLSMARHGLHNQEIITRSLDLLVNQVGKPPGDLIRSVAYLGATYSEHTPDTLEQYRNAAAATIADRRWQLADEVVNAFVSNSDREFIPHCRETLNRVKDPYVRDVLTFALERLDEQYDGPPSQTGTLRALQDQYDLLVKEGADAARITALADSIREKTATLTKLKFFSR